MAMAVIALTANAEDFTDQMEITVPNMGTTSQEATISVEAVDGSDGLYNITLKDFSFAGVMTIGDLFIENVKGDDDSDGYTRFEEITVEMQVSLGGADVPVTVTINEGSRMKDDKLYLDLIISALGMDITAVFGDENFVYSYTDYMIVSMDNGVSFSDPMSATISVQEQTDGKYTLSIEDFQFAASGFVLGIGNITATDIEATEENGVIKLFAEGKEITITHGSDDSIDWSIGDQFANAGLTIDIDAELTEEKLNAKLFINIVNVIVIFGEDYIEEHLATGISSVTTTTDSCVEAIYDLSGRKLNEMQKGINIVRKADGTTVKVLKK